MFNVKHLKVMPVLFFKRLAKIVYLPFLLLSKSVIIVQIIFHFESCITITMSMTISDLTLNLLKTFYYNELPSPMLSNTLTIN